MKYTIEFELPDNDTVLERIKTQYVQWAVWGYTGLALAKPVQKKSRALLPCFCGCNQRERWYGSGGIELVCKRCGKSVEGKSEAEARRNWNAMIMGGNNETESMG